MKLVFKSKIGWGNIAYYLPKADTIVCNLNDVWERENPEKLLFDVLIHETIHKAVIVDCEIPHNRGVNGVDVGHEITAHELAHGRITLKNFEERWCKQGKSLYSAFKILQSMYVEFYDSVFRLKKTEGLICLKN